MEISKKLKLMRKENNLTLKELSIKSGISISFISDIENGRRNPSIEKLKILARALDIPAGEFLKEETDYLINGRDSEEVMALARDMKWLDDSDKDILKTLINTMRKRGRDSQ